MQILDFLDGALLPKSCISVFDSLILTLPHMAKVRQLLNFSNLPTFKFKRDSGSAALVCVNSDAPSWIVEACSNMFPYMIKQL